MIELSTAKMASDSLIENFNPATSPQYLIVIAGAISLIYSCSGIKELRWEWVCLFLFSVIVLCLILSVRRKVEYKDSSYSKQFSFSRTTSISLALLVVTVSAVSTQHNSFVFFLLLFACMVQVIIFLIPTSTEWSSNNTTKINLVQLTLITGTFLVSSSFSLGEYSKRDRLSQLEIKLHEAKLKNYPNNDKITNIIEEIKIDDMSQKEYELFLEAKNIVRSTKPIINQLLISFEISSDKLGIHPREWRKAALEKPRYRIIGAGLFILWVICIVVWVNLLIRSYRIPILTDTV